MRPLTQSDLATARAAMEAARGKIPDHAHPRSPKTYTQPQLLALLVLRRDLRIPYREMADLIEARADLRDALGLRRPPHFSTLCYAESRLLENPEVRAILDGLPPAPPRAVPSFGARPR